MNETLKDFVLGVLDKGAGILIGIALTCGALLLVPDYWPNNKGLAVLAKTYQTELSVGLIAGLILGCCMQKFWSTALSVVLDAVTGPFIRRKFKKALLRSIQTLSREEWLVLAHCVNKNVTSVCLPAVTPISQALMGKGFIAPSTSSGDMLRFSYEIRPIAWDILTQHPSFSLTERKAHASAIADMEYQLSDWRHW